MAARLKHTGPVRSVAYSPDGTRLATASGTAAWVWHLGADAIAVPLLGHHGPVQRVAFSPDGAELFTASRDHTVRRWDARTGGPQGVVARHDGPVLDVAVAPDGTRLATASRDQTAQVWDLATGEALTRIAYGEVVQAVAFSPDGQFVATGSFDDDAGHLWSLATGRRLRSFWHAGPVVDVAFPPTGRQLATASWDKTARSWELDPGSAVTPLYGHTARVDAVAVSPDGTRLVTASGDQTARVWDPQNGAALAVLREHSIDVLDVAVSPDGTRIATASWDGLVRVYDAATGTPIHTLTGHTGPVVAVVYAPDGAWVATAGRDHTARVWEATTGDPVASLAHEGPVHGVVFSPDDTRVVTVGRERPAQVWHVATVEPAAGFPCEDPATAVAYSPDGQRLAVATDDHAVHVWSVSSGDMGSGSVSSGEASSSGVSSNELLHTLRGHLAPVVALAFSADGSRLATASQDHTARVWATDSGRALRSIRHAQPVLDVALGPGGAWLVTASAAHEAWVWNLEPNAWLAWGCAVLEDRAAGTDTTRRACASVAPQSTQVWAPADNAPAQAAQPGVVEHAKAPDVAIPGEDTTAPDSAVSNERTVAPNVAISHGAADPPEVITVHGVDLVLIPGGSFMMGSSEGEPGRFDDEEPQHEVTLSSFYMARTEVTNAQYALYLQANPEVPEPPGWGRPRHDQPDQPITGLDWFQAQAYCDWAGLSLPTEAQWEYAARAGTTTAYWFGNEADDLARFVWDRDTAGNRAHSVAKKAASPWGLFDMHGNVDEWCLDGSGRYTTPTRAGDGLRHAPAGDALRLLRSGSWALSVSRVRSAYRALDVPPRGFHSPFVGVRPVLCIN